MTLTTRPLRARAAVPRALAAALQWRLLLLWIAASLLCALPAAVPVWKWLAGLLDHSPHAADIGAGRAPALLLEAMMAPQAPMAVLSANLLLAAFLMLLLSPLLTGASVAAARARTPLGFGDLLRGGVGEYGPMLRLLLWSVVPLGLAALAAGALLGLNDKLHEHALLESDVARGRDVALALGGTLLLLVHAGIEAGRGWLAADAGLRSALKAWWRGMRLLRQRPLATLASYLLPTLCSVLLVLLLVASRQSLQADSLAGLLLGMGLASAGAGALAWGKVARLFALRALAEDAGNRR